MYLLYQFVTDPNCDSLVYKMRSRSCTTPSVNNNISHIQFPDSESPLFSQFFQYGIKSLTSGHGFGKSFNVPNSNLIRGTSLRVAAGIFSHSVSKKLDEDNFLLWYQQFELVTKGNCLFIITSQTLTFHRNSRPRKIVNMQCCQPAVMAAPWRKLRTPPYKNEYMTECQWRHHGGRYTRDGCGGEWRNRRTGSQNRWERRTVTEFVLGFRRFDPLCRNSNFRVGFMLV